MVESEKIAGVLLTGGLARRMGGGDKCLQILAGRPLLDHVITRLAPQVEAMALNANGDPARFAQFDLPVIPDRLPDNPGPLAGVLAGLRWAETTHYASIATVPSDTPFIPPDLGARLQSARIEEGAEIAIATSGGRIHPVIGIWPVALAASLDHALRVQGLRKVTDFLAQHRIAEVAFSIEPHDPFFNINSPADMEEAARLMQR